jgi:serine/threonine protein kinase/Tfp pilus assembly protein PilF
LPEPVDSAAAAKDLAPSPVVRPGSAPETPIPAQTLEITPAATEKPGDTIGRYKLLQQIGQGGFGVVYMAQQQDPVKRRVALKIVKLGMDTKQVVARFEAERQALALMDHPNIAKMLDAGATDSGRPYFVMELVKGIRITEYCDQNHLSPRERLELFVQICRAVQHAHQKGIIHRDIKPSNILVTLHDGVPIPKIIDFGIAKATQQELTEQTVFTQFGQFIGTPAYMSPEQAEMSGLDIDTRSDIYSLGVLLYELLTGKTPFDPQELMAAGIEAMRRTLREKEPARPSTKLSTLGAQELTATAKCRRVEAPKLVRFIRGDLDWIIMKCLEKDRTRRYETASKFADDLENFLKNEPVSARPPSQLYRFQRLVRRHRVGVAASATVALAIIAGLVVSTVMYWREKQARQHSQEVAQFLVSMLRSTESGIAQGRDTLLLREMIDQAVESMGRDLRDQPVVQADLCNAVGEIYRALGFSTNLTQHFFDMALTLRTRAGEGGPALASYYDNLGSVMREFGDIIHSESLERRALALRLKVGGPRDPEVAQILNNLGLTLCVAGKFAESETTLRQALDLKRELFGPKSGETVTALNNLALTLREQAKFSDALGTLDQALSTMQQLRPNSPQVAFMHGVRGFYLLDAGNLTDARAEAEQSLASLRTLFKTPANTAVALGLYNLALVLDAQGDLTNAATFHQQALDMRRQCNAPPLEVAASLDNLGLVLRKQGHFQEAENLVREALATRRKILGDHHPAVAASLNDLGLVLRDAGHPGAAEQTFNDALRMEQACYGPEHPMIATTLSNRARLYRNQGRLSEAESDARAALEMRRKLLGEQHPKVAESKKQLEDILAHQPKEGARPTDTAKGGASP